MNTGLLGSVEFQMGWQSSRAVPGQPSSHLGHLVAPGPDMGLHKQHLAEPGSYVPHVFQKQNFGSGALLVAGHAWFQQVPLVMVTIPTGGSPPQL